MATQQCSKGRGLLKNICLMAVVDNSPSGKATEALSDEEENAIARMVHFLYRRVIKRPRPAERAISSILKLAPSLLAHAVVA